MWNREPGGLFYDNLYSTQLCDYPFEKWQVDDTIKCSKRCSLVITCSLKNSNLNIKKISEVVDLHFIEQVILINCQVEKNRFLIANKKLTVYNEYEFVVDAWKMIISRDLSTTNCVIIIKNTHFGKVDKKLIQYGYSLWLENESVLIGSDGYDINWNGDCKYFNSKNSNKETTLATLDFSIVHRYLSLSLSLK